MEYKIDGLYENLLDSEGYYYNSEFIPEKNCMSFYKVKINGVEFNGVGLPDDILCEVRELFKNLKAERENKFNQVVEELVTGQRNIYFHIVGCDYLYYQAWVRNLPKDLTGQVQDVMTSAIKKIVGKDEFVPNSCEYLEKIAKKSIGTIEDLSDVLNPELDKEIQYYHDFNSNIVTGFELNLQTILKPVIKLNKEKEKIEQQREAERRTMKVEILSKGSHGDPYADVRITDPETGESAEFSCNNIFDFGYVVNPNYPLMDGMEIGGLQYKVRKAHSFRCGMDSMILNF